jgi:hypothetical protein
MAGVRGGVWVEVRANLSKNHHYVPKAILKRFAFSGQSVLLYDGKEPSQGFQQKSIERAFQRFHLNSYVTTDGEKDDSFERWLAKEIDDPIARALDYIEGNPGKPVAKRHRLALARYFCVAILRSPTAKDALNQVLAPNKLLASKFIDLAGSLVPDDHAIWVGKRPKDISSG